MEHKTDWADGNIVKPEDFNRIEGNINEIQTEVETVKKSVSDGKKIVAEAITAKGQATNIDDTFNKMAENISNIQTGVDIDTSQINATTECLSYGSTAYGKTYHPDTGWRYGIIDGIGFPPYVFDASSTIYLKQGRYGVSHYTGLKDGNRMIPLPFNGLTDITGSFFGLVVIGGVYYRNPEGYLIKILDIPTPVFLTQTNNTITETISYGGGTITATCMLKPDNYLYSTTTCNGVDSNIGSGTIDFYTIIIVYPIYNDDCGRSDRFKQYDTYNYVSIKM